MLVYRNTLNALTSEAPCGEPFGRLWYVHLVCYSPLERGFGTYKLAQYGKPF